MSDSTPIVGETYQPPSTIQEVKLVRLAHYIHAGISKAEVARLIGCASSTLERYLEHPLVKEILEGLQLKQETHVLLMKDRLRSKAQDILDGLISMGEDSNLPAAVRANVLQDLLDREGSVPRKQHVEHSGEQKIFSDEQFDKLMGGMVESANRKAS